jgi:hypothetical protein
MTICKLSKSFKKLPAQDSRKSLGLTSIAFCHEFSSAGETLLDFTNLVPSQEWLESGRSNASTQDILNANLRFYKNNIVLSSSSKGLIQPSQYHVMGTGILFKTFTSEIGEVFEVQVVGSTSLGSLLVAANSYKKEGILSAGNTEFAIGLGVKIFPEQIIVFKNGFAVKRNTDNSALVQDGDYYLLDPSSTGMSSVVKFNNSELTNSNIIVMSIGSFAERPTLSLLSEIETLASQLDNIIPTVANLAGVPESNYRSAANYADLYAFGQDIVNLKNSSKTKWQKKIVSANTSTSGLLIIFNNLEIGKTYKASIKVNCSNLNDSSNLSFTLNNGLDTLQEFQIYDRGPGIGFPGNNTLSITDIFVANDSVVSLSFVSLNGATVEGNITGTKSYVIIEELLNHDETNIWA